MALGFGGGCSDQRNVPWGMGWGWDTAMLGTLLLDMTVAIVGAPVGSA